ncbi:triple tyrosine motif-containing protein [Prolixibacter sp. NT017]|uniref:helix-turn-helix and ligand-binding sensor domain-containing protein n=1 Tax=Prolixibacter sp. NT017 TaxID=2652390 RepID=UPI0012993E92|nr:triple tyrosine motif-containing protein [Prolixibacter sp. NT017]
MGRTCFFLFCLMCLPHLSVYCQEQDSVWRAASQRHMVVEDINNFSKMEYGAAAQNWGVSAGRDGMMYFANNNGLLEFDGTSWRLHRLPNETIMRAVLAVSDSLIYTSGYREMGVWKRQPSGELVYYSLNPQAEHYFSKNEEFWNITSDKQRIYFHSFNRILLYQNDSVTSVSLPGFTNVMNQVRDKILIGVRDKGIYQLSGAAVSPVASDPFFRGKIIRFILPYKADQLMIGTASGGIVIWDGEKLTQWKTGLTSYFRENELNRGYIMPNGNLVIGTIIDGILVFDKSEKLIQKYNHSNGLQNNTVLGIAGDQFNNIWLALDHGIDFIGNRHSNGVRIESIPNIGAVYSAAIFQNHIYLGTNQGLFSKDLSEPDATYRLVPNTQSQNWDLRVIGDQLVVGHNEGTIVVENRKARFISRNSGGFSIREDIKRRDHYIQSTYNNLVSYKEVNGHLVMENIIQGFTDLIRYIEIDHLGNVWASHMHRGIYKLELNDKRDRVVGQKYYGESSVFGKEHSLNVFKVEDRIVFTTKEKLFTYDDLNDTIIPYTYLNQRIGDYREAHKIVKAPDHHYWLISSKKIGLFYITMNEVHLIKSYPTSYFKQNPLFDDFENILPVTADKGILCLENGISWLNASQNDTLQTIANFAPKIRELQLINRRNDAINEVPVNHALELSYSRNSIEVRYSFPHYSAEPVFYQAFLKGIDQKWSDKSESSVFRFDRLPAGTYQLQVKATNLWNNESRINSLTLEVQEPWYSTTLAKIGYFVLLVVFSILFQAWGARRTKKKQRIHIEKRERELILLRNKNLRTEIEHKSKELANSTMSMIKKNEFLLDLKQLLTRQKEQLGTRYPDKYFNDIVKKIDKNISSHDDWQIFETNFEQAHEQFLRKIKDDFPDLTAKDLRMCAYLRMNLSSKEIAPLLGITVRGVENHRYRLRKKMGLSHDDNLIDLILQY